MAYIDKYGVEYSDDNKTLIRCSKNTIMQSFGKTRSFTIPYGVTTIGKGAFKGCSVLENVAIPDSVTFISDEAFRDCTRLLSVTIPNSVETIGSRVFERSGLKNIVIGESVQDIGSYAFWLCGLSKVLLPNNVRNIGDCAFGSSAKIFVPQGQKYRFSQMDGLKDRWDQLQENIAEGSKTCPNSECGCKDIPAEAQFCPECGAKL